MPGHDDVGVVKYTIHKRLSWNATRCNSLRSSPRKRGSRLS